MTLPSVVISLSISASVSSFAVGTSSTICTDSVSVSVSPSVSVSVTSEVLEDRVLARDVGMRFIVGQSVSVGDLARRRIVAGEGERVAERRDPARPGLEDAVDDDLDAADGEVVDAVGRRDREVAGRREAFLARIGTVRKVVFIDDRIAAVRRRREVGDLDRLVDDGNRDRQRRGDRVAVAVGQRVGEDVVRRLRQVVRIADVGVIALGIDRQRAECALDDEIAVDVERRVRGAYALDRGQRRIVGANRVDDRPGCWSCRRRS